MKTCFLLIFSLCILVVPCLADSLLPSRSLIVFYSRSGFSRTIAEKMASDIGNTDLFELIPAEEDMLELGAWTFVKWAFRALWGSDCELKNKEIDLSKVKVLFVPLFNSHSSTTIFGLEVLFIVGRFLLLFVLGFNHTKTN